MGGFIMKVTSYLLSKQLAEAGFEANAEFYWTELNGDLFLIHKTQLFSVPISIKKIPAYDLETLIEALPETINKNFESELQLTKKEIGYYATEGHYEAGFAILLEVEKQQYESLADTAARLLLKLIEKGFLTFKK
jgi:maltodextrin utilization protein YvdJ